MLMKTAYFFSIILLFFLTGCTPANNHLKVVVYETSESGHKLTEISDFTTVENASVIRLYPHKKRQTITGFGGSFTEASASLLNRLSQKIEIPLFKLIFLKKALIIRLQEPI